MKIIRAEQLDKSFDGIHAVDGVSFSVSKGEIFGFLGPNGAGKTTTVRIFTGVITPDVGTAWIHGKNVRENPTGAKENIGIVPETANAYIDMTGWQNMMLMGELYGVPKQRREARAETLMDRFGLKERSHDIVKGYSKGMKKRLLLAMAMIHDPSILFLDEPIAGLDVQSQRLIKQRTRELHAQGKTIFLTTHNIPVANELCTRVAVINHGKIAAIDTPETLKSEMKGTQSVEVRFASQPPQNMLKERISAEKIEIRGDRYRIYTADPVATVEALLQLARNEGRKILSLQTLGPSLEDVFVELTEGARP